MNPLFSNHPPKMWFWLVAIAFLLLTACKSTPIHHAYEGPPKTANEVATFIIPENFNLLAIDGAKHSRIGVGNGVILNVLPGLHAFLIEYQVFWDLGGGEFEKVTSKPIVIQFTAQAGKQYTIDSKTFENLDQVEAFAKKPKITVIDKANKQPISADIKYNRYIGSFLNSLFNPSATAPTVETESSSTTGPAASASSKTSTKTEGKALEMLKYWWETADKEQQEHFQLWLKK